MRVPPVDFQGAGDHAVHGKALHDGAARGGADAAGLIRVVQQVADGGGDGGLRRYRPAVRFRRRG